jgi:hypothetical protein
VGAADRLIADGGVQADRLRGRPGQEVTMRAHVDIAPAVDRFVGGRDETGACREQIDGNVSKQSSAARRCSTGDQTCHSKPI